MVLARHTSFCGVLRSATIASRRHRSPAPISNMFHLSMSQIPARCLKWKSPIRLFRPDRTRTTVGAIGRMAMKLGFIGTGAITEAIVVGLMEAEFPLSEIIVSARGAETAARLAAA